MKNHILRNQLYPKYVYGRAMEVEKTPFREIMLEFLSFILLTAVTVAIFCFALTPYKV